MLSDKKTYSSINTFNSAMMNVINPESLHSVTSNSTSNNAWGYNSIMNALKYPTKVISKKPEITNLLNVNPLISPIEPHTDGVIVSQPQILQAYDVIPRIVNALRFQPNMILPNRFSPERKEVQSYKINTVMNRISPESASNVATMNTQRISQVYGTITRIVNALKFQSGNSVINRNFVQSFDMKSPLLKSREMISSMAEQFVMREISGVNSSAQVSQVRNIIRSMAERAVLREASSRQIMNNFAGMNVPVIPHAIGGIFSSPHIGLIAEAGREAVIPLDDRARGIPLLMAAANEIVGADFITNQPYSMPILIQQAQNQTEFQTAERQSETRGKITVNVDVKPSDIYIDGERIGRISYRWSERQSIRSGLDS